MIALGLLNTKVALCDNAYDDDRPRCIKRRTIFPIRLFNSMNIDSIRFQVACSLFTILQGVSQRIISDGSIRFATLFSDITF